jgi:hypothetical protein
MPIEKSTRTRKGLFGRQITVEKTKVKQTTPKGEVTDTYKTRTVANRNTGKSKERFVQKSTVKNEDKKPYSFKKVIKTKTEAPTMTASNRDRKTKGLDYESTKTSTVNSRTRIKQDGKVRRSKDKNNIITTTKTAGRGRLRAKANEMYQESLQDSYERAKERNQKTRSNYSGAMRGASGGMLKQTAGRENRPQTGEIKFR